jgi:hypothetical protein
VRGQLRIEQMYAWIALDPADNTEGIPSYLDPAGFHVPMVGADRKRIESLRPLAEQAAKTNGVKVTLVRFEIRTELETIEP